MKNIVFTTAIAILLAANTAYSATDTILAKKQLIQAAEKYAMQNGIKRKQLSYATGKIRTLSSSTIKKTAMDLQKQGIRLGEQDTGVTDQLADIFKSYGKSSTYGGSGHLRNSFGGSKGNSGSSTMVQQSMRSGVKGSRTSQQSSFTGFVSKTCETCADILDWMFKDPDEAYKDRNEEGGGLVYGGANAPKGCLGKGCKETPNPERTDSNSGSDPMSRQSNISRINANSGKYGFKRGQSHSSATTIDPKTGKETVNKYGMGVTKLEKLGNPIKTRNSGTLSEREKQEVERKVNKETLTQ